MAKPTQFRKAVKAELDAITKESHVLNAVDAYLSAVGITHWRNNTGMAQEGSRFIRYGKVGSSDFLGICPDGRFLAVECKRPGGKLTREQSDFIDMINAQNGVAIVVNSIESLATQLKGAGII
jgi:hypothetical protein